MKIEVMNDTYDDIINLPHPDSRKHPRMPMRSRAAQFAPFAALTGHGAAINQAGKEVEEEMLMEHYYNEWED